MGCNCGRRRVVSPRRGESATTDQHAEALIADAQVQEVTVTDGQTSPATGAVTSSHLKD
jgi:hypothetical protein